MEWDLIIFDCDGILVDSEPIADRVFPEVLASEGIHVTPENVREWFTGYSIKSCVDMIEKRLGVSAPKDIKEKYYSHLFDEFKKSLKAVPGIDEALAATPYPKCVASSGEHEKIQFSLGITGLLPKFKGRIFSATDVENGKPAPDLFLHAAEKCNANPQYCAVIEDQAPGVKAGVAAGMRVFAYVENTDLSRLDKLKKLGATVFNNMKDLPRLLKEAK